MESLPLRSLSARDTVSNVCLFISDSLRFDCLPDRIRDMGVTLPSAASASYTAASIPSMLTGRYPSTHGCWRFDDRLPARPSLFRRPHSYRAGTIWTHLPDSEKPPIRMTKAETGRSIKDLAAEDEGFVYVEHDKGGHSPYGHSFEEHSTPSFFESLTGPEQIPDLYEQSIQASTDRFNTLRERLDELDLLEETLVVFASDHGELLGEPVYGALYAHGRPMVPEVVRVPLVFMGAGLPEGVECDTLAAGVDIAPTLLGALGEDIPTTDGCDLWMDEPSTSRRPRSEFWLDKEVNGHNLTVYRATSKWSQDGGVVYHHPPRWVRLAYGLYAHLYSEAEADIVRSNSSLTTLANVTKLYLSSVNRYGDSDDMSVTDLREIDAATSPANTETEDHYTEDQLRHLGYIE